MEFSNDLDGYDGYFDPVPPRGCTPRDTGSAMQTNVAIASLSGGRQLPDHRPPHSLYSLPADQAWTLPYNSPSVRDGHEALAITGNTHRTDIDYNVPHQQALQLASFGSHQYAASLAHALYSGFEQWFSGHEEHFDPTSWPYASPYLYTSHNTSVYENASRGMLGVHENEVIKLHPLPQSDDLDQALPHYPTMSLGTMIGYMYSTDSPGSYIFKCHDTKCESLTFGRWYDYKRHYNGAHAAAPIAYWCEVEGCPRSEAAGDRPFSRKDKVKDHVDSVHGRA